MIRVAWAVAAFGSCLALGCGSSTPVGSQTPNKDALTEVGQMLKALADEGKRPPGKPADLEPVEPLLPTAGPLIREGTLVYVWGAPFAASGEQVVAYEKKAASEGGWVLLQNGSVKEMSAADFAAAPKAK